MNTTVQTTPAPAKASSPRRSRFPGKESGSVSFNLTALGRQLLKEQAAAASVSNGDYVEMLIRERAGMPPLRLPPQAKQTGPKGGAKSFFFGKNRGTTTAVCVTPMAHRLLDEQVAASRMSRGDYIEYLLREKSGLIEETFKTYAQQQAAAQAAQVAQAPQVAQQPAIQQTNFAPPVQQAPVVEVTYAQPVITPVATPVSTPVTSWNNDNNN
ncbi:MAG: hypothetical protein IPP57_16830 [Candidatus Obscuribacter sp.]|jgi:hypothetical protein|nr:hypothetical protein [Candidatus Obscuribacter sp.]MDQ5967823.1 hypothetical protein [Cyanobacteriota bacterium erpe_2018_sw_39hr_WHONDRS-SW48-000098_B_bin.30]MBK7836845.1 hypothetical protein [Candidatus Obscuribacter sp.]MBK9203939.1 hypothetical protein [Candidatus Obscuribacter sp.]MBK9622526.1 hypothetical protein [Candidatus Obscuribacter sp.]